MKAITSDEMRELERFAIGLGIPSRVLMEIAGMKAANIATQEVKRVVSACVICGTGGNGGDGFVAARYLHSAGIKTDVFLISPENAILSPEAVENLKILKNMKIRIIELSSGERFNDLKSSILEADIVIDAIFGIGAHGEIKDVPARAIDMINGLKHDIKNNRPYLVLSIDVPSGIDATTGEVPSKCIEADITVTFERPKIGLFRYPASKYAGRIITTGIGIPELQPVGMAHISSAVNEELKGIQITDTKFVSSVIPRRKVDCNKGDCGKVLIVAGSSGMMGAAVMTARAALRAGSGLVTLCVPDDIKDMVNSMSLEIIVAGFGEMDDKIKGCDVVAIGPGLSNGKNISRIVKSLLLSNKVNIPLVIDADGLNSISDLSILKKAGKDIVITPHPGEFARLAGRSIEEIQKDRTGNAMRISSEYGITTVLKGAYTVIAGKGRTFINPTGNPGMASAGVGDVLTGVIASLIGQGVNVLNSAAAGAFIHGLAGNLAASIRGEHGMIASDVIDAIPYAIASII